jgi:para-nitrobenzyl esterase
MSHKHSRIVGPMNDLQLSRRQFLRYGSMAATAAALWPSCLHAAQAAAGTTTLQTPDGDVTGDLVDGIGRFRGIPFAEPPVGALRFRAPVASKTWKGVREALAFAPAAMQVGAQGPHHNEDCLYLNVWMPAGKGPFPVLVWIHGGGYLTGSAAGTDGSAFARQGVACVTVAYRLGALGFMDLGPLLGPDYAGSANNGMRDLVCALGWVKRNIAAFGGDPARVTIGGQSAGAKAVATLMAIPQATDLFHAAISESGGGERADTALQAAAVARSFGEQWRRDQPAAGESFADLLTAPATSLMATQRRFLAASPLPFPLRPQIDGASGGAFLPSLPVKAVAGGSARGKRLLIGSNLDESASFLGAHPDKDPTGRDLNNLDLDRFDAVLAEYKTLYPEMLAPERRIRAVTAEEYWVESVRLADANTGGGGQTWMYRMDFAALAGGMKGEANHGVELAFVWDKLTPAESADPAGVELEHTMHGAWLAFLQGRPPAAPGLPVWPVYRQGTRPTMIFGPRTHVEERPLESELRLWDGIL